MNSRSRPLLVAHVGFVLTGAITILLGPILPSLSARWALTDSQAGALFAVQFGASLAGTAVSGRLSARFGFVSALSAGFAVVALGLAGLTLPSWPAGVLAVLLYGGGLGIVIPTANMLVSHLQPHRQAAALNILNFAWCIGAAATPPAIAFLLERLGLNATLWGLSGTVVLLSGWAAVCPGKQRPAGTHRSHAAEWRTGFSLLSGVLLFLYVGAEMSVSGWIGTYILRRLDGGGGLWAFGTSVLWSAILVARLAAPAALRRISGHALVFAGACVATGGLAVILTGRNAAALFTGVFLTGLGFGPIFPTVVANFTGYFGGAASHIAWFIFAMGGLGGAVVPSLVGQLSTASGSLQTGLSATVLCILGVVLIEPALRRCASRAVESAL
ncbi:MAG TPA: MFS transporter [Bryobacteraceae bacterium]|nr:MFS transporter [Bryobacteraceae bacterium]